VFAPAPGSFPGKDLFVTIRAPLPNAWVLYTLDGSVPQLGTGALYVEPIPLAKTATRVRYSPRYP
jgi:hypothetical protein